MRREKPPKVSREEKRRARRQAGEAGGKLAHVLMSLKSAELDKLALDEDLRFEVDSSRKIRAQNARRREERRLAGVLRAYDMDTIFEKLNMNADEHGDVRRFKLAESWRNRLIDSPDALGEFLQELPALDATRWRALVADAKRQRDTGKPKGASKLLFREVREALE